MIFTEDENQESSILIAELKETIAQQKLVLAEIKKLYGVKHVEDKETIEMQTHDLLGNLNKLNEKVSQIIRELVIPKTLFQRFLRLPKILRILKKEHDIEPDELEKKTLKRLKERVKIKKEKEIKEESYGKLAKKYFSKSAKKLINKKYFIALEDDLGRANLKYTLPTYVSIILLTTFLGLIGGLAIFLFFLFFSVEATLPIVSLAGDLSSRFGNLIWIVIALPILGFIISYTYPSMERKSAEVQIDYELPFATINMAAIAGSLINPVKIFEIIISSDEFPSVKKEITKLMNSVNVYGEDIVTALRNASYTSPSKKMSELFNGLATTINSGGDLTNFFETRAESLLFDYKINREKETKTAETFMDLYISIVIAAPMIFMLLLMMIKISGLGISLATSTITLIMVGSVFMINIFFLVYLHLKKTG